MGRRKDSNHGNEDDGIGSFDDLPMLNGMIQYGTCDMILLKPWKRYPEKAPASGRCLNGERAMLMIDPMFDRCKAPWKGTGGN